RSGCHFDRNAIARSWSIVPTLFGIGGGLAVGAAGVAGAVVAGRGRDLPVITRGDLAGNTELLKRIRKTWQEMAGPGDARILWAGSTPAGPVALVAQEMQPSFDALGFVDSDGDQLRTTGSSFHVPYGTVPPGAMLAGPDRDVLVVTTAGRRVEFSPGYRFDAAGHVQRTFTELTADENDMVVHRFTPSDGVVRIALREPAGEIPLANLHSVVDTAAADNQIPERINRDLPGWERAGRATVDGWDIVTMPAYGDPYGYHVWTGPTEWHLRAATPDGRRLVVQTVALDGTARVFWMHGQPTPHYLGLLEDGLSTETPAGVTVLHARLPEKLGVAVAALDCTFRYRTRSVDWLPVSGPAALLPDAAAELEVNPARGQRAVVPLP
ncbi:hypothetical protein AB0J66_49450, partial [Actinoplanes sp. NPDC049598]|uniref:hypothetical protein n=1 Tax=Actinoplanes sp. NPDC049598 TaxID=3154626 RepID=UPI003434FD84